MKKADDRPVGEDKFFKGRVQLVLRHTFYSYMLLKRPVVVDDNMPFNACMGVDGVSLFYSPERIKEKPIDDIVQIFCHEVIHIMGDHPAGLKNRNELVYLLACEYAVNGTMKVMKERILPDWIYDSKYDGMDHIQIYNLLLKDPNIKKAAEQYERNKNKFKAGDLIPGTGIQIPSDIIFKNPKIKSEADEYIEASKLKREVAAAVMTAKMAGNFPAEFERLIQGMLEPKIDWREILQRFLSEKFKNDFAWSQPNRRYLPMDVYLPSLTDETTGSIGWFVDSSGSIDDKSIAIMHTELFNILSTVQMLKVTFLACDAKVYGEPIEVRYDDPPPTIRGGGGTDYRPAFAKAKELNTNFSAIVYLTDGYCSSFPEEVPQEPVLWVLIPDHNKDFKPPFGEVIIMGEGE